MSYQEVHEKYESPIISNLFLELHTLLLKVGQNDRQTDEQNDVCLVKRFRA